jgi:hypothetical protein
MLTLSSCSLSYLRSQVKLFFSFGPPSVSPSSGTINGEHLAEPSLRLVINNYNLRLWIHRDQLIGSQYRRLDRWPMNNGLSSYSAALQPLPAYLGLVLCLSILLVFSSACMWNGNRILLKVLNVYFVVRTIHSALKIHA